jgi:hypothetical protein
MRRPNFEEDNEAFPTDAYSVAGYRGIAWRIFGWETQPDEDTEWSGCENRTGKVVAVMVGDDRRFILDPEDLTPLADEDYCGTCGQIGCTHGGL